MKLSPLSIAISSFIALNSQVTLAEESANSGIEIITITAPKLIYSETALAEGNLVMPDVADWLKTVPGANINKNGPITGIAQYRGMYGDRVAKSISGHQIISAGPNAMDAPLTYINPIMVESVSVYRGIAPVTSGMDSIGGAVEVKLKRAMPSSELELSGDFATSYNSINQASTFAGDINISANDIAMLAYFSDQQGDDYEDALGNTIKSTQYDKQQSGIDIRFEGDNFEIGSTWHHSTTKNSGTPALPMDIDYIKSDRFNVDGSWQGSKLTVVWNLGYQDATHGMDNFSQRINMMNKMHRYNTAIATTVDYKLVLSNDDWQIGLEGFNADHDSTITNPSNMMFEVLNFNDVKDQRDSVFVQWSPQYDSTQYGNQSYSIGLRIKQNRADANNVSSSMAMMMPAVKALQTKFNQQDKSISDTTFDLALNSQIEVSNALTINYGLGVKQRAASYQERYLWLPMQATGGLADGKTYVGNINLSPETAYQADLGLSYTDDGFSIAPRIFYQKINDYIQGTPTSDMQVNMVANMMGSENPLQFSNIDATIYGMDLNWDYRLTQQVKLSGVASYVRGTRDDINDDLYRMSPLNSRVNIYYQHDKWQTNLSLHAYAKQNKVSQLNTETATGGYALIDWQADYFVSSGLVVRAGVNNLLNKQYSDHLAGVNRAKGSDIAVGDRINGMGRNIYLAIDYQF